MRTAVLDDDPTGSQAVHGVAIATVDSFEEVLSAPGASCFILTNTRSLAEPDAVALTRQVATRVFEVERDSGEPFRVVSRSDSTLRGHLPAEVVAIDAARREVLGAGYDAVLLVPAYLEAGRFTSDDIHFANIAGVAVPVGETEFARDATFGFRSSDLRDVVVEKGAAPSREWVLSVGLDDIRGGVDRVADLLRGAFGLRWVVVNATDYGELEVVERAVQRLESEGQRFLFRTGPSFVRTLLGVPARGPLTRSELADGVDAGHGLIVVGSHVAQTTRQLARLVERLPLHQVELDVPELLADPSRASTIGQQVASALADEDVLLTTSRTLVRDVDPARSLEIAATVSTAVTEIVRAALAARPTWVLAKGGITSHDVAVRGLGLRRAMVLGQFFPGMVSAFQIDSSSVPDATGIRYVVFAGNVGDDDALAEVVERLRLPA